MSATIGSVGSAEGAHDYHGHARGSVDLLEHDSLADSAEGSESCSRVSAGGSLSLLSAALSNTQAEASVLLAGGTGGISAG